MNTLRRNLFFANVKNQQNGGMYEKIQRNRCEKRGETIWFQPNQLRTKFKKCVGECKKEALTILTASGIKRFQEEKGYGARVWFCKLFELVKTRHSCQLQLAIEPSASNSPCTSKDYVDTHEGENDEPVKAFISRINKNKKKDPVLHAVELVKSVIEKDPTKDLYQCNEGRNGKCSGIWNDTFSATLLNTYFL